jgi:preprotein translocase subunit YajC
MTVPFGFASLVLLQATSGGSSFTPLIFQFGLIFAIFYFLMIRPQQQQRKQHEAALRGLKRGDRVVTGGGIIAEVIHIREKPAEEGKPGGPTMEDEVTIKSGDTRLIVERGRIAKVTIVGDARVAAAKPESGGAAT